MKTSVDGTDGMIEVVEDDETLMGYLKRKRLRVSGPSLSSLPQSKECTTLDQPVFEAVASFCSHSRSRDEIICEEEIITEEVIAREERSSLLLDCDGQSVPVASDLTSLTKEASGVNKVANNMLLEFGDEVKDIVPNSRAHNLEGAAENSEEYPTVSSDYAWGRDCPLHLGHVEVEQSAASEAIPCVTQKNGPEAIAPMVLNESVNVAVDRSLARCTKKLIVLDVNGLLVDISSYVPYDYDPDDIILRKAVFKRPYCDDFLKFCFERFNVGVWSSRTRFNMEPIIDFLLGKDKCKLLFCWDQSHCTNTGFKTVEKRHKPMLLKKLKKLWDKCEPDLPWEKGAYNETNTLLLDDSPYKALCNPRYTAIFPCSYHFRNVRDNSLGPGGDLRVYLEGLSMAHNVQEYVKQNPFGQRPITEKNLSWGYYLKVIEACSSPPRQTADNQSTQGETS